MTSAAIENHQLIETYSKKFFLVKSQFDNQVSQIKQHYKENPRTSKISIERFRDNVTKIGVEVEDLANSIKEINKQSLAPEDKTYLLRLSKAVGRAAKYFNYIANDTTFPKSSIHNKKYLGLLIAELFFLNQVAISIKENSHRMYPLLLSLGAIHHLKNTHGFITSIMKRCFYRQTFDLSVKQLQNT